MWRVWWRREGCTGCWWENLRERGNWGDPDVGGRIILTLCRSNLNLYCLGRKAAFFFRGHLTLNLLTTNIVASKLQMGFNSAFKGYMKNQQIHQLFIQFINYVWELLHVSALHCHLQGAFLVPSERCSIEEQSIEYCRWACCV